MINIQFTSVEIVQNCFIEPVSQHEYNVLISVPTLQFQQLVIPTLR